MKEHEDDVIPSVEKSTVTVDLHAVGIVTEKLDGGEGDLTERNEREDMIIDDHGGTGKESETNDLAMEEVEECIEKETEANDLAMEEVAGSAGNVCHVSAESSVVNVEKVEVIMNDDGFKTSVEVNSYVLQNSVVTTVASRSDGDSKVVFDSSKPQVDVIDNDELTTQEEVMEQHVEFVEDCMTDKKTMKETEILDSSKIAESPVTTANLGSQELANNQSSSIEVVNAGTVEVEEMSKEENLHPTTEVITDDAQGKGTVESLSSEPWFVEGENALRDRAEESERGLSEEVMEQPTECEPEVSDGDRMVNKKFGKEYEAIDSSKTSEPLTTTNSGYEGTNVVVDVVVDEDLARKDETEHSLSVEPSLSTEVLNSATGEGDIKVQADNRDKQAEVTINNDEKPKNGTGVIDSKLVDESLSGEPEIGREAAVIDKEETERGFAKDEEIVEQPNESVQEVAYDGKGDEVSDSSQIPESLTTASLGQEEVLTKKRVLPENSKFSYKDAHMEKGEDAGMDIDEVLSWKDEMPGIAVISGNPEKDQHSTIKDTPQVGVEQGLVKSSCESVLIGHREENFKDRQPIVYERRMHDEVPSYGDHGGIAVNLKGKVGSDGLVEECIEKEMETNDLAMEEVSGSGENVSHVSVGSSVANVEKVEVIMNDAEFKRNVEVSKDVLQHNAVTTVAIGSVGDPKLAFESSSGEPQVDTGELTTKGLIMEQHVEYVEEVADRDFNMDKKTRKEAETLDSSKIADSSITTTNLDSQEINRVTVEEGFASKGEDNDNVSVDSSLVCANHQRNKAERLHPTTEVIIDDAQGKETVESKEVMEQCMECEPEVADGDRVVEERVGKEHETLDSSKISERSTTTNSGYENINVVVVEEGLACKDESQHGVSVEPSLSIEVLNSATGEGDINVQAENRDEQDEVDKLSKRESLDPTIDDDEKPKNGTGVINFKLADAGKVEDAGMDIDEVLSWKDETPEKSQKQASVAEMLSQLHLAAQDPMNGYTFLNTIIPFFKSLRPKTSSVGKPVTPKKRKSSNENDPEEFEPDDVNDSYWTDRIIQNHSEEQLMQDSQNGGTENHQLVAYEPDKPVKARRRKYNHEIVVKEQQSQIVERRRQNLATEVVLKFPEGIYFPSEVHLNKMFRRFGPLMESETEVDRQSGRARVVFKKCSDAEVAHNSAGKFNIFGSIRVNYELNYTPIVSYKPLLLSIEQDPMDAS